MILIIHFNVTQAGKSVIKILFTPVLLWYRIHHQTCGSFFCIYTTSLLPVDIWCNLIPFQSVSSHKIVINDSVHMYVV